LYGTVYEIFNDNISPSKRFYMALDKKLDETKGEIESIVDDLNGTNT